MQKSSHFDLNVDQAAKINRVLPKGYKLITVEDHNKRLAQMKRKPKIAYVPVAESTLQQNSLPKRVKTNISYYEGDEPAKSKAPSQYQSKSKREYSQKQYVAKTKQSNQFYIPQSFNKNPMSPKQIIQQLQNHHKFYIIRKFQADFPDKSTYNHMLNKAQSSSYLLNDLFFDMRNLFINIYGAYPRTSEVYNDAAELEGFLTTLINTQKGKLREPKQQKPKQIKQSLYFKQQITPPISRAPSQLIKKKTIPAKPDFKNITIMDKRILGQNIKKLPNQCLPEICRIVFETLETREEYVIDIDTLPLKKVKQLQIYVNNCMSRYGDLDEGGNEIRNEGDSSESSFIIENDFD